MLDQWCCLDSSIAQHGKSVSQLTDSTLISLYMVNMVNMENQYMVNMVQHGKSDARAHYDVYFYE
jgi:hypothetical protein